MIRRLAIALALVAGLTLAAWWLQDKHFDAPTAVPTSTSVTTVVDISKDEHLEFKVIQVAGVVERGDGEHWEPLNVGDVLNRDSVIRSRVGGAILSLGDKAQIQVTEDSQFRVGELSNKLSRVKLEGGRIEARVHGGADGKLAVEVMGTDAVAEASDGDFAVMRGEDAQVTIASKRGVVDVAAQGTTVKVSEGEQSIVEPEHAPSIPEKIPPSLFLKLSNQPKSRTREKELMVEGETAAGAIVSVNGVRVSAKNGRFAITVPLNEGNNELNISAKDALGRRTEQKGPKVFVDTQAPKMKGRVVW